MIQPIRIYGDPVLEQSCSEVTDFASTDTKNLIADLLDTCHATENSAGLAAPQIGVLQRTIVVRTAFGADDTDRYLVLINPRILSQTGRSEALEGCLSIPGHRDKMTRPTVVTVQYQDQSSEVRTVRAEEFFARALVHEIDHLDGRLFIHYFGNAYCVAVKEWLGRQGRETVEKEPIRGAHDPEEIRALHDTEEIPALPEASFVQAKRPEDDLSDDTIGEMADRES